MTEPVRGTTQTQKAQNAQQAQQAQQPKKVQQPTPENQNIGRLLANRAGAVIMAPATAIAGTLTLVGSFWNGVLNPNTTIDESMAKGIESASEGAEMLDKMWQGKFF